MSYNSIAEMARNNALRERIAACASAEGVTIQPTRWADENQWFLAASPGWAAAWASALASNNEAPGRDEGVITDGMILASVQGRITDLGGI